MANPNYQLLIDAAKLLKPMLGELVFVGGCTTGLLITDKAAADVRPTFDVDAIAGVTSYVGYTELSEKLKKLGFREDAREGAPRCRWRQNTTTLDVMPVDGTLFGFRNVWYGPAVKTAEIRELEPGLKTKLGTVELSDNGRQTIADASSAGRDLLQFFHFSTRRVGRFDSDNPLHCDPSAAGGSSGR
jgi:hypothetical protein